MIDQALTRSMGWFQLHADHRMKAMKFYVILLAGALAVIASSFKDNNVLLQLAIGISIATITYVFKNLDRRIASLIKDAEEALRAVEHLLVEKIEIDELNLIDAAENKNGIPSYRESFNILFLLGYALAGFVTIIGIWGFFTKKALGAIL